MLSKVSSLCQKDLGELVKTKRLNWMPFGLPECEFEIRKHLKMSERTGKT